jgi:FkbM family methyltransferase
MVLLKEMNVKIKKTGDEIGNVTPENASELSVFLTNPNLEFIKSSPEDIQEKVVNILWNGHYGKFKVSEGLHTQVWKGDPFSLGKFVDGDYICNFNWNGTGLNLRLYNTKDNIKQNGDIWGVFVNEEYKFLDCDGGVVIDIGANIGDSAIYFALKGAEITVALEPYPYSYSLALDNIRMNGLSDKITLLNAGYGKKGTIEVDNDAHSTGDDLRESKGGEQVNIYSLADLLSMYRFDSEVFLKVDCEGCEYHLLDEEDITLKSFKKIQIEYHLGYKTILKKLVEAGFRCKVSGSQKFGYLYAERPRKDSLM